jgi:hypothetical protein
VEVDWRTGCGVALGSTGGVIVGGNSAVGAVVDAGTATSGVEVAVTRRVAVAVGSAASPQPASARTKMLMLNTLSQCRSDGMYTCMAPPLFTAALVSSANPLIRLSS